MQIENDKNQADAHAAAERDLIAKRFYAAFGLGGFFVGGAIGHLMSFPIMSSALVGGIAGTLLARLCK